MSFGKFSLGRVDYSLSHLDSFDVTVPAKDPLAAPAILRVTFSHHVFSEKWDGTVHTPDHEYKCDGERRAFCPVRHGCSIRLPELIPYHVGGKAFYSRDGKGALNTMFYAEADGVPYPIFFNLRRADRLRGIDGILHVVSAYRNRDMPARHRLQSVKFARLVHQICPPEK